MRGTVVFFDQATGRGYINGTDSRRYTFERSSISAVTPPYRGMLVDYIQQGVEATEIFALPGQAEASAGAAVPSFGSGERFISSAAPTSSSSRPPRVIPDGPMVSGSEDQGLFGYALRAITSKYADFSGRARRKEYWGFFLFQFLLNCCIIVAFSMVVLSLPETELSRVSRGEVVGTLLTVIIAVGVIWLALVLPGLAVSVRRFHDRGLSGWFYLLLAACSMVPLLGFFTSIAVLVICCLDSQSETNRFGPPPK